METQEHINVYRKHHAETERPVVRVKENERKQEKRWDVTSS